jgi:thymidylate kinase
MLKRKTLVQSADDLRTAGRLGMLLFSEQHAARDWQWEGNSAAVSDILSLNAMPLAYMRGDVNPALSSLLDSTQFGDELGRHQERYDRWKEAFKPVKDIFLSNGVHYAFIKSPSLFPYTSGNLDVMVKEKDFTKAGNLLERIGFIELKNIREPHKYLYKRFDCGKEIVAIHLHSRVSWGATFIDPDSVWARVDQLPFDDVVFALSPEDCLLTTFAHSFYENSAIRLLDLCIVRHLAGSGRLDWQYLTDTARAYDWEDGFHLSVLTYSRLSQELFGRPLFPQDALDDARQFTGRRIFLRKAVRSLGGARLTMPFYLPLLTTKLLAYRKMLRSKEFGGLGRRIQNLAKLLFEVVFIHIMKLNPQKGMLVAISGADGSGKTTHAHALVEVFQRCGLSTCYLWTRAGSQTGFWSLARRLTEKSAGSGKAKEGISIGEARYLRFSRLLSAKWRRILWKTVNTVDFCIFYNLMLRTKLLKRQIVVCDRYVADIFMDLHVYYPEKPQRIWLGILRRFLPKPATSILVATPADVALQRSSEGEPMEFVQRQVDLFDEMQRLLKMSVVDNATREFRDVCNELTIQVLHKYYGKKCVWFGWDQKL